MMDFRIALFILHGCVRETTNTTNFTVSENNSIVINSTEQDNKMNENSVALLTTLLAMGALGAVLNIPTVFIIGFGRRIGQEVKISLINMALSDLLLALMTVAHVIITFLYFEKCVWAFDPTGIWTRVNLWYASPLCSAVISMERLFVVSFPLSAYRYTTKHKLLVAFLVWVIAAGSSFTGHFDYNYITLIKFIVPTLITISCYTVIFIKLHCRMKSGLQRHSSNRRDSKVKKLQTMLVVDAGLTIITWIPFVIRYGSHKGTLYVNYETIDYFLYILTTTNAFTTPVVYLFFNQNFRKDAQDLFRVLTCRAKKSVRRLRSQETALKSKSSSEIATVTFTVNFCKQQH
ncbi:neuropeptide Y receptor type 1-like [Watersipora subatra]|uniref:neuropeptide Y receptor type 1-like n=1 Tax=Watersipora subatra TaxID=2589382 RepID=UPI00355B211F